METVIINAKLVSGGKTVEDGALVIQDGVIQYAGPREGWALGLAYSNSAGPAYDIVDAGGGWIVPGFVDIHIHGGYGSDFMDASEEAIGTITRFHAQHGTTTLLATTMTQTKERIDAVLETVAGYSRSDARAAKVAGVHLEGPFISPRYPGSQNPAHIVDPDLEWMKEWQSRFPGLVKIVTMAPEREGALPVIRYGSEHGIVMSAGHTAAVRAEMEAAIEAGLRHSVHMFNAMTPLHHREPGVVGTIMARDEMSAEIIADGIHVHPLCVGIMARLKDKGNLVLITDAMSAAGLGDGMYKLGGLDVIVKGREARLYEGDSLAGSTLTMAEGFRFMVREIGLTVPEASLLASANPARMIGMDGKLGDIRPGYAADLVWLSEELELKQVWIDGQPVKEYAAV
ncbi:N-acetylglucosamine-6-phosphate deacetylase [Paenibacillus beijingensis]|uniref:N-acetylglucosamine-6-phosphate deacetylase n=1 Tax=Paenibacillus beijingensis TaxID=1126833 RepID=A0A0D5NKK3_9BACL|nr:N-acetylglucosamine-6-phosphate deacetylase [Paenibacillus beijingensis]AJY75640.1 N-acetylglucosamine-6-phosphate deacetylase [Paenibacillus beijingensis]